MELVTRDISLVPSIGRMGSMIPSFNEDGEELSSANTENYTDWGKYPMDVVLSGNVLNGDSGLINIKEGIPLNDNVLRYKNLSDAYGFLKNFSHSCKYYRMIKRNSEEVWSEVSDTMWEECYHLTRDMYGGDTDEKLKDPFLFMSKFFVYNWIFKDRLPDMSSSSDEEKRGIAVSFHTDEFMTRFRVEGVKTRYEETFYNLVRWLINNKRTPSYTDQVSYSIPYNKITFLVDSDISTVGLLRPYIDDWVPNKRYYVGDCVWYTDENGDRNAYRMAEIYDVSKVNSGETYNSILSAIRDIPDSDRRGGMYIKYIDMRSSEYVYYRLMSNTWMMYIGLWEEVDTPEPYDNNGRYWKGDLVNGVVYFDTYHNGEVIFNHWEKCPTENSGITKNVQSAINDSYLRFMQRTRKSYDDDGNELPFNISTDGYTTELRYCLGNTNSTIRDGKVSYDRLQKVTIYNISGGTVNVSAYTENESGIIPTRNIDSESGAYIEFVYNDNMSNSESGVTHTEIYSFEKKIVSGLTVDGSPNREFDYIDIDYTKTYVKDGDKFTTDYDVKSQITYPISRESNDPSQNIPVFSDESLLGISSFNVDVDVQIDRGGASAFERHHILSEINTFEDLLNYKNNMFNL